MEPKSSKHVRVAAYCRVSVAEREQSEFGSLLAQRESIEAYARSQMEAGWALLPDHYNDEGYSGGNTNRPAFQRLMEDARAGLVDVIAVYKFDRLSRRQIDFLRAMEELDRLGVKFVSITQNLDTTTSMGRCMLNIMSAFAQLEREVIAERTSDKMQAARRRGMWTGGRPVLGYDVVEKRLVVNEGEAEQVRLAFQLYLDLGSTGGVAEELRVRDVRCKAWVNAKGERVGGGRMSKSTVNGMLQNPLYLGRVRAGGDIVQGDQEAIVEPDVWDAVQAKLRAQAVQSPGHSVGRGTALLAGKARCRCGAALTPSHSTKGSKRYSYYACSVAKKRGASKCPKSRVAAGELEQVVVEQLRRVAREPEMLAEVRGQAAHSAHEQRAALSKDLADLGRQRARAVRRRDRLLDHLEAAGSSPGVEARLRDAEGALTALDEERVALQASVAVLRDSVGRAGEVVEALRHFDGGWGALDQEERARLVDLVVERVTYDGRTGGVDVQLR